MTTSEDTTPIRSARKQVACFTHDANARNDQKILRLRARGGWAYYGIYWALIEVLRESSDYRMHHDALEGVALSLGVREQEFVTFISTCCQVGLLVQDDIGYTSPSLLARMERYEQTIQKRREAGSKGGAMRAAKLELARSNPLANATQESDTSVAQAKLNNNIILNNINYGSEGSVSTDARAREESQPEALPASEDNSPVMAFADRHLVSPTDPIVAGHALFLSAGKRPMKKYPDVWLTPLQLAEVAELYEQSGIPRKELHLGFRLVATHVEGALARGRLITTINAHAWLIGHGLTQALEQRAKSLNVKRQEKYLEGTR